MIASYVLFKACKISNFKALPFKVQLTIIKYMIAPEFAIYFAWWQLNNITKEGAVLIAEP